MIHPIQLIRNYFDQRTLKRPDTKDAYIFLVSEVGELGDALMRKEQDWVRNTPNKDVSIADELADVYMMLHVLAANQYVDLDEALKNKLERKLKQDDKQRTTECG